MFGLQAIHPSACSKAHEDGRGERLGLATLWLVIVLVVAGCRPAAAHDSLASGTAAPPSLVLLAPGEPSPCPPPTLNAIPSPVHAPGPAPYALLTVTHHAHATVVALGERGAVSLSEPQVVGKVQLAAAGDVLGREGLTGINPLHNVIEVTDLATGAAWRVEPGEGCAAFGFALDTEGERLALLQVAMRGRLKPAPWQVSVIEFASGRVSALGPAQPQEIALEPVAWLRPEAPWHAGASQPVLASGPGDGQPEGSGATDEIVLRAFIPFQADGAAGLWAARADGSRLRPLLRETDYVGQPRLSPDGRLLAFFASEPENLPAEYVASPGEPPANALRVLDVLTGETRTLATDAARAFGTLAWDATGERLYLSRGAWRGTERGFQFDEIVSLSVNHSTPELVTRAAESVVGLQPCAGGGPAYVTAEERGAVVRWDGHVEWVAKDGAVEILACLTDE